MISCLYFSKPALESLYLETSPRSAIPLPYSFLTATTNPCSLPCLVHLLSAVTSTPCLHCLSTYYNVLYACKLSCSTRAKTKFIWLFIFNIQCRTWLTAGAQQYFWNNRSWFQSLLHIINETRNPKTVSTFVPASQCCSCNNILNPVLFFFFLLRLAACGILVPQPGFDP